MKYFRLMELSLRKFKARNEPRAERMKDSEWKVRIAHEIQKKTINIRWHSDNLSVEETVST